MKVRNMLTVAAVCVSIAASAVPTSSASAAAKSSSSKTFIVYTASPSLIPSHRTVAAMRAAQRRETLRLSRVRASRADIIIQPADVVSGYHLNGTRVDNYHYNSNNFYMDAERCDSNGNCTQLAQVYAQVRENVVGGTSKRWLLTENAHTVDNPGGISWHYTAIYYCAVNISGGADHYCGNGADASGTEAPMTPGEAVYKTFEKVNNNTVYPMVGITVHWSTGGSYTGKFREWDTLNRATTTKLNTSSGTGY